MANIMIWGNRSLCGMKYTHYLCTRIVDKINGSTDYQCVTPYSILAQFLLT